jgi:hypothetical protein
MSTKVSKFKHLFWSIYNLINEKRKRYDNNRNNQNEEYFY